VFFASSPRARRLPNSTGIVASRNYGASLQLAATLQPNLRHVFVVGDNNATGSRLVRAADPEFQSFANRFTIDYVVAPPATEMAGRFGALPPDSIIYYLSVSRAGDATFHPLEYLDRLAAIANAPIYSWVDSAIDHGIVGGSLKSQETEITAIGNLALRVLRGEAADSIPVTPVNLMVNEVDWRQLRRWGIRESRLPAGTVVLFRETSVWERYGQYMVAGLAILLGQTALIAGLLVQKSRRRQAERRLRRSEADLRTSYARIRQLAGRLLSAQETERSRIARELHDDVVQKLSVLAIELKSADGASREQAVHDAVERIRELTIGVRDLSHELHPPNLRLIGLLSALKRLLKDMSRPDVSLTFEHDDLPPTLSAEIALCLFRIAQESLHNALKYSHARQVTLQLRCDAATVRLITSDDGVGFDVDDAAWGRGLGLMSMVERLEACGGSFTVHSRPGAGTRIEATVPVSAAEDPPRG
jgi:signal transduction histidine kinase